MRDFVSKKVVLKSSQTCTEKKKKANKERRVKGEKTRIER